MSLTHSDVSGVDESSSTDSYLALEDVARRLDLPLGILRHRVEAGDVPARREEGPFGVRYSIRLSDLGVDPAILQRLGNGSGAPRPQPDHDVLGTPRGWPDGPAQPAPQQTSLAAPSELRREVAAMTLDPRELVAGLLDRWERTLEQRIYAEQRMRFEAELNTRQNLVKQLQLELQTARAEQAAALSDRDRRLAENERHTLELQTELASAREAAARKRGRLFRR